MPEFSLGDWVWVEDDDDIHVPGQVVAAFDRGEAAELALGGNTSRLKKLDETQTSTMKLRICREVPDYQTKDLIQLGDLSEETLLHCLRIRFKEDKIYTNVGTILVSVNPYKLLSPLYADKMLKTYLTHQNADPHTWQIAGRAHASLVEHGTLSQSILISGESGAGKTESTKQMLNYLTAASEEAAKSEIDKSSLKAIILQSNPLTEAFGNARTGRNDNSSRFGKLISLSFNESGAIEDGNLTHYMLEKSRVVGQEDDERNYHAFHYLLADSALAKQYHLKPLTKESYRYINLAGTGVKNINGRTVEQMNAILTAACYDVGITKYEVSQMYSLLSAILLLGNLEYSVNEQAEAAGQEAVVLTTASTHLMETASNLLGLDNQILAKVVLSHTLSTNKQGSIVSISHNEEAARATVATLCKALYCSMFGWSIMKVNLALHSRVSTQQVVNKHPDAAEWLKDQEENACRMVHILDIFGFESFRCNGFEQLCINYCNEALLNHFNEHIFTLEQQEYKREGLNQVEISYESNDAILQLIEAKRSGLFEKIDEALILNQTDDRSWVNALFRSNPDNKHLKRPHRSNIKDARSDKSSSRGTKSPFMRWGSSSKPSGGDEDEEFLFMINHSAEQVVYDASSFLIKSTDKLHSDLTDAFRASTSKFVLDIAGLSSDSPMPSPIGVNSRDIDDDDAVLDDETEDGDRLVDTPVPEQNDVALELPARKFSSKNPFTMMRSASIAKLETTGKTASTEDCKGEKKKKKSPKKNKVEKGSRKSKFRPPSSLKTIDSIGSQFKSQLGQLMALLKSSKPFMIRCIKSNEIKAPGNFASALVLRQMRYMGLVEVCRMRQVGFSTRIPFTELADTMATLITGKGKPQKIADQILKKLTTLGLVSSQEWLKGKTKLFMKEAAWDRIWAYRVQHAAFAESSKLLSEVRARQPPKSASSPESRWEDLYVLITLLNRTQNQASQMKSQMHGGSGVKTEDQQVSSQVCTQELFASMQQLVAEVVQLFVDMSKAVQDAVEAICRNYQTQKNEESCIPVTESLSVLQPIESNFRDALKQRLKTEKSTPLQKEEGVTETMKDALVNRCCFLPTTMDRLKKVAAKAGVLDQVTTAVTKNRVQKKAATSERKDTKKKATVRASRANPGGRRPTASPTDGLSETGKKAQHVQELVHKQRAPTAKCRAKKIHKQSASRPSRKSSTARKVVVKSKPVTAPTATNKRILTKEENEREYALLANDTISSKASVDVAAYDIKAIVPTGAIANRTLTNEQQKGTGTTSLTSTSTSTAEVTSIEPPGELVKTTQEQQDETAESTMRNFVIEKNSSPSIFEADTKKKECPVQKMKAMGKKVTRVSTIAVNFGEINEKILHKSVKKMAEDREKKYKHRGSLEILHRPGSPASPRSPRSPSPHSPKTPHSPMSPHLHDQNQKLQNAGVPMRRKSVVIEGTDQQEDRFEL